MLLVEQVCFTTQTYIALDSFWSNVFRMSCLDNTNNALGKNRAQFLNKKDAKLVTQT